MYDPELIHIGSSPGNQNAAGRGGGGNGGDGESDAGDPGDGAAGGGSNPISVDVVHCGDGRVTGTETCDISIAAGKSGACPTECPELRNCAPRALNNPGGCQASCVLLELVSKSGDDCCPGKCNSENDDDCSSSCGDGLVQMSSGETCEPDSDTPCKASDAECDDGDACTLDKLMGSATNCNSACSNTPLADPKAGDGCCPSGANANTDSDCMPRCGNGVREGGEECDGSTGCDSTCKPTLQPDQVACIEKFGSDPCGRCSCINCTDSYLACRDGTNQTANAECQAVLACAEQNDCFSDSCYCGQICDLTPSGPCRTQIEAAADTTDPLTVNARRSDLNYPVGRALAADTCRIQQCASACRSTRMAGN